MTPFDDDPTGERLSPTRDWNAPLLPDHDQPDRAAGIFGDGVPPWSTPLPPAEPAPDEPEGTASPAPPDPDVVDPLGAAAAGPPPGDEPSGRGGRRHARRARAAESADGLVIPSRTKAIIGVVVAFVVIAAVGFVIASTRTDDSAEPTASTAKDGGQGDLIGIFGSLESFDHPNDPASLGLFADQRPWQVDSGVWGILNNSAYLSETNDERSHAVIGLGGPNGAVQVRMTQVAPGSGLVFRYKGPFNYWAVLAVPNVATWNIVKVVDGDQQVVGNTGGQSPVSAGTTIAVRMDGDTIEVIVNGRVRATVTDSTLQGAGKVGITAARGDEGRLARFDDFVAALPGGRPLPAPSSTAPADTTPEPPPADETPSTEQP